MSLGIGAEVSVGAFDLVNAGIEGNIKLVTFDFGIGAFTKTYFNELTHEGSVKGTLGIGPYIGVTGPQGELKIYVDLPLLFSDIRLEQTILSFQAFQSDLYDEPFYESSKTNWIQVARPDLIDYQYSDLNTTDEED